MSNVEYEFHDDFFRDVICLKLRLYIEMAEGRKRKYGLIVSISKELEDMLKIVESLKSGKHTEVSRQFMALAYAELYKRVASNKYLSECQEYTQINLWFSEDGVKLEH